jgi:ribosomal protein L35
MQKYKSKIEAMSLCAKKFAHWDKLRTIQNSKIISSTYVWLFVVPLAAKFLSKINDTFKITTDGIVYEFVLKLPFSWEVFFYSSLCFVIGNILYIVKAPELIKDYKDYGEFIGSRRNLRHLSRYKTEKYKQHLRKIYEVELAHNEKMEQLVRNAGIAKKQSPKKPEEDQFWEQYDYLNLEYQYYRYVRV